MLFVFVVCQLVMSPSKPQGKEHLCHPGLTTSVIRSERSRKGARSRPAIPSPSADPTLAHS